MFLFGCCAFFALRFARYVAPIQPVYLVIEEREVPMQIVVPLVTTIISPPQPVNVTHLHTETTTVQHHPGYAIPSQFEAPGLPQGNPFLSGQFALPPPRTYVTRDVQQPMTFASAIQPQNQQNSLNYFAGQPRASMMAAGPAQGVPGIRSSFAPQQPSTLYASGMGQPG